MEITALGAGLPTPPLRWTAGLPETGNARSKPDNLITKTEPNGGDLRSSERRGQETRAERELRAEHEALSLIHFLRDQGQPQSEWLTALSADQTLSEPVRQRALQFARE